MRMEKAIEIVGYYKRRAKINGCLIWIIILMLGAIGTLLWNWYVLPIAICIAFIGGTTYSIFESKRIERITGLNIHEQAIAYKESCAAKLNPIAKDLKKYWSYIKSMPD
jgi:hypothetical protein